MREYMITKHRLQPFSPGYFEGKDLRSYSLRDFHCAQAIRQGAAAEMPPFFTGALPAAEDAFRTLTLDDLCRFLENPCRYILQKRLGIYFDAAEDLIEDREPFALAGLERYTVEQELLDRRLAGADTEELYPSVRAQGLLPHGMVGELVYDASVGKIDDFIEQLDALPCPCFGRACGPCSATGAVYFDRHLKRRSQPHAGCVSLCAGKSQRFPAGMDISPCPVRLRHGRQDIALCP